jgi:uncharacterized protein (DUF2164 family)
MNRDVYGRLIEKCHDPEHTATLFRRLARGTLDMSNIEFSREEKDIVGRKIQLYFTEELQQEIGQFDAEFLLDFFAEEIGPFFYNRGLYDAQAVMEAKLVDIGDALYEIEKPTQFSR